MAHNSPGPAPAPPERIGGISAEQREALARVLGSLGAVADRVGADRSTIAHPEGTTPRISLREALRNPSTRVVQWNGNDSLGPTVTARVETPGTVLSAADLGGHTLILTNEKGDRIATNFGVAVKLPPVDTSGRFVRRPGEPLDAKSIADNPVVGENVVIGEPFGNGPIITHVTIEGDAFTERHDGLGAGLPLDTPHVEVNKPDPTFAASDFLAEAHRSLVTPRIS